MPHAMPHANTVVDSVPSIDVESLKLLLNQVIDAYINALRQSLETPTYVRKYFMSNLNPDLRLRLEELYTAPRPDNFQSHAIAFLLKLVRAISSTLEWLPIKSLVWLFVGYHIQSRIQQVILFLQQEEVRMTFSSNTSDNRLVALGEVVRDLRKFDSLLSKHIRFKLFISASPFFAPIAAVVIMILPKEITSLLPVNLPLIYLSLIAVVYLCIFLVPGFSFKRYLFEEHKIYYLERELFSILKIDNRSKEFPLDLFGMIFLVIYSMITIFDTVILANFKHTSIFSIMYGVFSLLFLTLCIVQLIRALIRRYKYDNL